MEYATLNNGVKMPMAGIGTFLLSPDEAEASVLSALGCGYRLIDTANAYVNEKAVGRAIKKSGVDRKDIFLETKLWPSFYEQADAVDKTLERLDTDYIDLLLIHQPAGNYIAGYQLMEKAYKEGKVKAIGLSNFNTKQIQEILDLCEVKPAVLQTEVHPYSQEKGAEGLPVRRGHCHPGLVSPGSRGQVPDPGALLYPAGKEVRQVQRPDHPPLAHPERQYRDPRLQEPGPHQGQLRPVRLHPHWGGDGGDRRHGPAEAVLPQHPRDAEEVRRDGSRRGRAEVTPLSFIPLSFPDTRPFGGGRGASYIFQKEAYLQWSM